MKLTLGALLRDAMVGISATRYTSLVKIGGRLVTSYRFLTTTRCNTPLLYLHKLSNGWNTP